MSKILSIKGLVAGESEDTPILNGLNLELGEGEIHAVVGDSATGKSTLVKILKGLLIPQSGSVYVNGLLLEFGKPERIKRYPIGFILNENILFPELSVAKNICLEHLPTVSGLPIVRRHSVVRAAESILNKLDLNIGVSVKVRNIDRECQRLVMVAKAFAGDPKLVVADEPSSGLSPEGINRLHTILLSYKRRRGSVLYFTRQWEQVISVADYISVLRNGRLEVTMPTEEVRQDPEQLASMIILGSKGKQTGLRSTTDDGTLKFAEVVMKASELLTSEYELSDVLAFLVERAAQIMGADCCVIELIDQDTNAVVDKVRFGLNGGMSVDLKESVIRQVVKSGSALHVSRQDADLSKFVSGQHGSVDSFICIPIKIRTRIAGTIQLFYGLESQYSEERTQLLYTFARQAALAIENTRLIGRSALLQEAHHRIKNNLQSIVSLLSLQTMFKSQDSVETAIKEAISRIKAIAAVHDVLSRDGAGTGVVNAKDILVKVINGVGSRGWPEGIKIDFAAQDVFLSYKKVTSLALVVNELLTNCFKHAFPGMSGGHISVEIRLDPKDIVIRVRDNGIGLPEGFNPNRNGQLGLSLVRSLVARDLEGEFFLSGIKGTTATVIIPRKQYEGEGLSSHE